MRVYILEGGNLGGHLGILPTIVCEIPISQMLKLRFRCMMKLAQGHRRTELGFRSGPIDSEPHASNPSLHHHHAFIPWPSPDVLTLLFAACGEVQVAAFPGFALTSSFASFHLRPQSRRELNRRQWL